MGGEAEVRRRPEALTSTWLADALATGPIERFGVEPIGTGQMSESRRVSIDYAPGPDSGPASVVLKTASADENSRAAGVGLGVYEREVRFYRELAPRIGGPLAECHLAAIDPQEGWFTLILEDVAPAVQGDQIAGCTVEQARLAIHELAMLPAFLERYGERVAPEHSEVCARSVASLDGWAADSRPPLGLVHGDYRLDNMLFGASDAPRRFVAVDWQTVSWGPVMTDVAYFLGSSLSVEDRRENEHALVREYHEALHAHGVRDFDWEDCWSGYRRETFLALP